MSIQSSSILRKVFFFIRKKTDCLWFDIFFRSNLHSLNIISLKDFSRLSILNIQRPTFINKQKLLAETCYQWIKTGSYGLENGNNQCSSNSNSISRLQHFYLISESCPIFWWIKHEYNINSKRFFRTEIKTNLYRNLRYKSSKRYQTIKNLIFYSIMKFDMHMKNRDIEAHCMLKIKNLRYPFVITSFQPHHSIRLNLIVKY